MTRQTRPRHRGRWMLAVAILVLMLTLAACGGRAHRGGGNSGTTAGNTTSQQYTGPDLSSDDQQIQGIIQSMNSVSSDANTDFSSQDINTVP